MTLKQVKKIFEFNSACKFVQLKKEPKLERKSKQYLLLVLLFEDGIQAMKAKRQNSNSLGRVLV